ncbi:DUF1330 domain-containing protein [Alcaligenes aquatilis]|uniref:DUF1330 domain-containing protein n=1 Tax=Alcaligenes aquatilis TaxID=323284 RepID=UPI003F8E8466
MPAYLIARVHVHDPKAYANYAALSPAIIKAHDGRFLARSQEAKAIREPASEAEFIVVPGFKV